MLKALALLLSGAVLVNGFTSQWTGQPGQPWTEEETLAVKAKIVQIFIKNRVGLCDPSILSLNLNLGS